MIGRTNRFHGRNSLQRHYSHSQTVRGANLALRYAPSARLQYRASVVVSRKVSKSAVVRGRIRRRIYENVRILSSNFTGVYDVVFFAYDDSLAQLPAPELAKEVRKLCQKAGLIAAKPSGHAIVEPKD
ncbi:MAG TPA: ribonuclease P protein component [Candidatus Saccharimonadales bacterium]|nr:ribonuclease P protein component [Candidatus Saccharimonadales bacterium]